MLDHRVPILTYRSAPLSALAVTMMKNSQNLFAETLQQAAGGPPAVREQLAGWGIENGSVVVADGSGLSRYNLATAAAFVTILTHVYRDERLRGPFEASLPIAGRDGTLGNRMKGTAAEGNAHAKTGAFSNARGLSGYLRTADGEPIVFTILANNFGTTADVIEARRRRDRREAGGVLTALRAATQVCPLPTGCRSTAERPSRRHA